MGPFRLTPYLFIRIDEQILFLLQFQNMTRLILKLFIITFLLALYSCGSMLNSTNSTGRTLILDGIAVADSNVNGFTNWYCKDFVYEGPTLFEIGHFNDPQLENSGYIIYEKGNVGTLTKYSRTGLEQRWDWVSNGEGYSFILKPDGTGLYYDFTSVPEGESTKASDVYKCYTRKNYNRSY